MSDLLGPLLGMSPFLGNGGEAQAVATWANMTAVNFPGLIIYGRCPCCGGPGAGGQQEAAAQVRAVFWQKGANIVTFPAPEPGIHWRRTGGKSWRVMIVR